MEVASQVASKSGSKTLEGGFGSFGEGNLYQQLLRFVRKEPFLSVDYNFMFPESYSFCENSNLGAQTLPKYVSKACDEI